MHVKTRMIAAPLLVAATVALSVAAAGTAAAQTPCGRTNQVAAAGATVYRTATGFTPTGEHIAGNTVIRDGKLVGNRVEVIGKGYIATTALKTYSGATCW